MTAVCFDVSWWPPGPEEQIGEERAQELVQWLREAAGPVFHDAEADLRSRLEPDREIERSGARLSYIARFRFDDTRVRSLCVGVARGAGSATAKQNSVQLGRDGVLRWRREKDPSS